MKTEFEELAALMSEPPTPHGQRIRVSPGPPPPPANSRSRAPWEPKQPRQRKDKHVQHD